MGWRGRGRQGEPAGETGSGGPHMWAREHVGGTSSTRCWREKAESREQERLSAAGTRSVLTRPFARLPVATVLGAGVLPASLSSVASAAPRLVGKKGIYVLCPFFSPTFTARIMEGKTLCCLFVYILLSTYCVPGIRETGVNKTEAPAAGSFRSIQHKASETQNRLKKACAPGSVQTETKITFCAHADTALRNPQHSYVL